MADILWISGGRIIDPASQRDETGDLFAVDGRIVDRIDDDARSRARRYDATGKVVCPGLVDIHVHFRDPGQKHKESIRTGSRAAAAGGFTSVVCMPNTSPPADNTGTLQQIVDAIERDALIRVYPTGCITVGMQGERLAPIGSLAKLGVVAITDDGFCVQNNEVMRRALEYSTMFELPLLDHCQDAALTANAVMNEGDWSLRLGLTGWPNAAEDIIVARNIILSHYTGAQIHMQHISSAFSVDLLRSARERGIRVSGEATPHHIALTDAALATYDPNFKMNPPLRTEADREALIAGLLDGTLECIATDHAPHAFDEKDVEFDRAPNGITGSETALAVSLETLYHTGRADLGRVVSWLTDRPATILQLDAGTLQTGAPADVCVFDPDESWTVEAARFQSRSANSPWVGQTLRGRVHATFLDGRMVWDGETIHP